jgi:hypothetical protein
VAFFAPAGQRAVTFGAPAGDATLVQALVTDASDRLVVAGETQAGAAGISTTGLGFERLTSAGTPDAGFGTAGTTTVAPPAASQNEALARVRLAGDGSLVAGGAGFDSQGKAHQTIVRLTPTGAPDGTLAPGGVATGAPVSTLGFVVDAAGHYVFTGPRDFTTATVSRYCGTVVGCVAPAPPGTPPVPATPATPTAPPTTPVPPAPPAVTPNATAAQNRSALRAAVARLSGRLNDIRAHRLRARPSTTVTFGWAEPGTLTLRVRAPRSALRSLGRIAAARTVALGSGSASRTSAGSGAVTLTMNATMRRLLRKLRGGRSLRPTLSATFTPAKGFGAPVSDVSRFTVKPGR